MLTPAQYTALASELNTDPKALGYAANITTGNDAANATLLNALTGAGAASVFLPGVPIQTFIQQCQSAADWVLLTTAGATFNAIQLLSLLGPLDCTQLNIRTILTSTFSGLSTASKTTMTAVASRTGSRAEVLFGAGTQILASDVAHALGRG